ncbi:MAG TPA: PIG-L family deacetylase [Candidatus Dormibacteraeota bacterium]|nr:PIG-L family deacetylase [Candidatus Dormibacteraeota bacterium]
MATIIAFHAHPDDEVLLTGGTLVRLASEGHRTVIVVACDGVMGEAVGEGATLRLDELRASARVLRVARVVHLGYADSGHGPVLFPDPADRARFVRAPIEQAAARLAEILREERADILLIYDPQGGYGHRDHVRVHQVGVRAAQLAGTSRVVQATMPREPLVRIFNALRLIGLLRQYDPQAFRTAYSPQSAITHRIDVRRFAALKRAALACHRSQICGAGRAARPLRLLAGLPSPLFGLLLGREWFVDPDTPAGGAVRRQLL